MPNVRENRTVPVFAGRRTADYIGPMLRTIGILILALQFRPVVVAAVCLAGDSSAVQHCAMMTQTPDQTKHRPTVPANCPAAQLCSASHIVLPAFIVLATPQIVGHDTIAPQSAPRLHVAEPTAPPVPPPNA